MSEKPAVPEAEICPRCGNRILLGDIVCSRCGYTVQQSLWKQFKDQPPNVVSLVAFAFGILFTIAATGMEGFWQTLALILAFGFMGGGGMYYGLHILLTSDERRKKPGQK